MLFVCWLSFSVTLYHDTSQSRLRLMLVLMQIFELQFIGSILATSKMSSTVVVLWNFSVSVMSAIMASIEFEFYSELMTQR